ncbi:polymorphic transmembrane cluster 2 transmembrane protein 2 [Biomphalaria pfeifferi]|uniref:Polymorphic transmembrane cluster 2 transmembrane protein 2 n=1 Tax=Biomphalaria pfeifferi TaxID=112525 RepID=A0AAD8C5J7_BIOPF|nr:polymorphic transmembrane cluster 2 transmembrane protein 2 [Biomphalaria pfeifferi]
MDNVSYNLIVTANNTMRSTNNDDNEECWGISYMPKMINNCCFQIFSKAENLTCESRSEEKIHVSCAATRIFPEAFCYFTISRNSLQVDTTIMHASNLKYQAGNFSDDLFYYNASCDIQRNITLPTVGSYTVHVSMFPNITGTLKDSKYGLNKTLNIKFESPSISFLNCTESIEKDVLINCLCAMKGLGSKSFTFSWFNTSTSGGALLSNASLLTFEATKYDAAFLCVARSETLNINFTKVYNVTLKTTYISTITTSVSIHTAAISTDRTYVSIVITVITIISIFFTTVLVSRFGNCRSRYMSKKLKEEKFSELFYATEDFNNEDMYILKKKVTRKSPRSHLACVSLLKTGNATSVPIKFNDELYARISFTEAGHYHIPEELSTSSITSLVNVVETTCSEFQLQRVAHDMKSGLSNTRCL